MLGIDVRRLSISIGALSLLSACASLTYQEPTTGPRARVRFAANPGGVLRTYGDADCTTDAFEWMRLRKGYLFNSTPKRLGMPLWHYHENAAKEVYVKANTTIHAIFKGEETDYPMTYDCGVPFSFTPREGHDYEVHFKWINDQSCRVRISELYVNSGMEVATEIATFTNNLFNEGCLNAYRSLVW